MGLGAVGWLDGAAEVGGMELGGCRGAGGGERG